MAGQSFVYTSYVNRYDRVTLPETVGTITDLLLGLLLKSRRKERLTSS